jgi:hypothetical protein
MKAEDIVVDDLNNEKLIRLKSIKSAPDSMRDISPEIRAKIAKGLASGVKIYLIELGVYNAKKGYNANRLSHQIARFLKVTNTSNFNPEQVAEGFGVNLNGEGIQYNDKVGHYFVCPCECRLCGFCYRTKEENGEPETPITVFEKLR